MKTILSITALLTGLTVASAQITENRNVGEFHSIEVGTRSNIHIVQSDSDMVTVSSKGTMRLVSTKVENGVLHVNSTGNVTCTVHVKSLNEIVAKDASIVKSDNEITSDKIKIVAEDASRIEMGIKAKDVEVDAKDASRVTIAGSADNITVSATDASTVSGYRMKVNNADIAANDASDVRLDVAVKVTAKSSESSDVHIAGNPAQKSTSTNDNGMIKLDETGEVISGDNDTTHPNSEPAGSSFNHHFSDGFIGFGFVTGSSQTGAPVKYGNSREFEVGFGGGYKLFKWNGIGFDLYYKATDFYLTQDTTKTITSNVVSHAAEKISFNNFGGLVYDRFFIGKFYLDGGFYYDWTFHTRHVFWDNNTPGGESTKTVQRNLTFANPSNYGLTFRFGATSGLSLYFNYRLSDLIKQTANMTVAPPQLPQYTVGITLGNFD